MHRLCGIAIWTQILGKTQMPNPTYTHRHLREVLTRTHTIAAVGVSLNEVRPSYFVGRYLRLKSYKVLPVNPRYAGQMAFGETVYPSLADIPRTHDPVQMVDIFRRSEDAGNVVDEALDVLLDRGLQTIWMQIGVIDAKAARRAEKKGVTVIMNHCPKMEYQRLWGELSWGGINSGVISAKLW
jgi:predicted CoA-binding protein